MATHSGTLLNLLMGCMFLAACAYVVLRVIPRTRARLERMVRTEGVVEAHVGDGVSKMLGRGTGASGLPRASYHDGAGNMQQGTVRIGQARNSRGQSVSGPDLSPGVRVPIRYDPQEPDWVMMEGLTDPLRAYRYLASVTGGMGLMMLLMALR